MRWPTVHCPFPARAHHGLRTAVEDTFFNSVIPSRVDHLIGFTPTTFAMHPRGQRVVPITVRVGGRTYRYIFGNAAAAVGPTADIYLRNMIRARRFPSPQGIFLDRRLKAAERRHVQVRADLGRDADVLAVRRGHPACASGVSRAVARDRRGDDPYVVGGRRPDPGERGRDRAAPRRQRGRSLRGAPLPRRHPAARGARLRATAAFRGRIGQPRNRGRDELVASPCVPRNHLRGPGRRGGAERRVRARAVALRRLPDLVRDAAAPPRGAPDRRRLREVPHRPARRGLLPPARMLPARKAWPAVPAPEDDPFGT